MLESLTVCDLDAMCIESVRKFAERLRKLLDERCISRVAFAQATGIGVSSLQKYLRGDAVHIPLVSVVVRCAIVLGVSTDYLLGLSDDYEVAVAACSNSKDAVGTYCEDVAAMVCGAHFLEPYECFADTLVA